MKLPYLTQFYEPQLAQYRLCAKAGACLISAGIPN